MPTTVIAQRSSTERNPLDAVRPQMAKVEPSVNASQLAMSDVVRDGLIRACGSLKAAALTMGIDQGQLTRDLQSGKFNFDRLDRLSADEKAVVISCLADEYRPLTSPVIRARALVRQAVRVLAEIEQFIDYIEARKSA